MCPFKAPGPDVFQTIFFQKSWEVVKDSFISFFKRVLLGEEKVAQVVKALLILVPKIHNPIKLNQF